MEIELELYRRGVILVSIDLRPLAVRLAEPAKKQNNSVNYLLRTPLCQYQEQL